ncbi:MAG: YjbH domain-containing protein [Deltaproteobacteria bacterium]|nr:YjbH domain-containing protein [Deltaproteobacteria bacterium]
MKYFLGLLCLLFCVTFPLVSLAESNDKIKPLSSFAGYSGLWDMPNARVLPDWNIRIGTSLSSPYYYFHTTVGLFDRIELNGRLTGIQDLPALGPGYGNLKDKAIDVKFILLQENLARPAIAVGATDIHGTGLFTSRYLAMSKQIGPLDFTLGLGQGMFAGKSQEERNEIASGDDDNAFSYLTSDDTSFSLFGGLEYKILDNLRFTVEYTSIKYEKVTGGYKAKTPWNLGLKYSPWNYLHFNAAYARGQEWSAGILLQFPLEAEGLLAWKKEPKPVREEKIFRKVGKADDQQLAEIISLSLQKDGFMYARVVVSSPKLWVELENTRYNSPGLALGRAFQVVDLVAPNRIKKVYLVLVRNEIFQTGIAASRKHLRNFTESTTDKSGFFEFSLITQEKEILWQDFMSPDSKPKEARTKTANWSVEIKPQLANLLNDPSGFFKTRLAVDLIGYMYPWKGGHFQARYSIPFYNDISTSTEIKEPEPANTDYIDYLSRQSAHLTAYGYDHIFDLPGTAQGRIGLGAFEAAYVGLGAEYFKYFRNGAYGLGLESELVWKRNVDKDFAIHDSQSKAYKTYFLNLYGQPFSGTGVEIGLKIGRFLAGDHGVRIDICRTFNHFTIGAWYTITDTSGFVSPYNRGYEDKGVFISFPLSAFTDRPARGRYRYSLVPWTRDPGRTVKQFRTLYPFGDERETTMSVKNSIQEMRK